MAHAALHGQPTRRWEADGPPAVATYDDQYEQAWDRPAPHGA
jgi:hypothetical protein